MDSVQREIYSSSPTSRAYLEYYERIGGEIELYRECIKQGKSWQELLGTSGKWDEIHY